MTEVYRWSDRKNVVQLSLFGCYVFARIAATIVWTASACCQWKVCCAWWVRAGRKHRFRTIRLESVAHFAAGVFAVDFALLLEDRTTCAHPQRSAGWDGSGSSVAQRRSHSGDQRGCDPAFPGSRVECYEVEAAGRLLIITLRCNPHRLPPGAVIYFKTCSKLNRHQTYAVVKKITSCNDRALCAKSCTPAGSVERSQSLLVMVGSDPMRMLVSNGQE